MIINYEKLNTNVEKICAGHYIPDRGGRTFALVMMTLGAIEVGCNVQIVAHDQNRSNHIKMLLLDWIYYYSRQDEIEGADTLMCKVTITNFISREEHLRGLKLRTPHIIFTDKYYPILDCTVIQD